MYYPACYALPPGPWQPPTEEDEPQMKSILSWGGGTASGWASEHKSQYTFASMQPPNAGFPQPHVMMVSPVQPAMMQPCQMQPVMLPPNSAPAQLAPPASAPAADHQPLPESHEAPRASECAAERPAATSSTRRKSRPPFHTYGRANTKPTVRKPGMWPAGVAAGVATGWVMVAVC